MIKIGVFGEFKVKFTTVEEIMVVEKEYLSMKVKEVIEVLDVIRKKWHKLYYNLSG